MTREQAVKILETPMLEHFGNRVPEGPAAAWVDALVALGLLNLDEPETVKLRFCKSLDRLAVGDRWAANIWLALESAGLKIVEK